MGQYWKAVNLDKRQFISPWELGSGAKLWEQLANPGPGRALIILLAAMPEPRSGGDLKANPVIGSWAGDRVVLVGTAQKMLTFHHVPCLSAKYIT